MENKYRDLHELPVTLRVENLIAPPRHWPQHRLRADPQRTDTERPHRKADTHSAGGFAGVSGWEDNLNDNAAKKKFAG